jgi:hypothetical protein
MCTTMILSKYYNVDVIIFDPKMLISKLRGI